MKNLAPLLPTLPTHAGSTPGRQLPACTHQRGEDEVPSSAQPGEPWREFKGTSGKPAPRADPTLFPLLIHSTTPLSLCRKT